MWVRARACTWCVQATGVVGERHTVWRWREAPISVVAGGSAGSDFQRDTLGAPHSLSSHLCHQRPDPEPWGQKVAAIALALPGLLFSPEGSAESSRGEYE